MARNALYFDELTLYHNLYFNIHCVILSATYSVAWDQAPHCEKKEKKSAWAKKKNIGERREPKGSLGRAKGGRRPVSLPSTAWPIFFLFDPVFCLFAPLRSLIPGYILWSLCFVKDLKIFDFIKTLQLTKIGYSGPVSIREFILTNSHVFLKTSLPNKKALEIISIIGCSISLFAVLITMAVTLVFWRQLKSPRVKVLLNLCAVIASSCILVILEGSARNKEVCKILSSRNTTSPHKRRVGYRHSTQIIPYNKMFWIWRPYRGRLHPL